MATRLVTHTKQLPQILARMDRNDWLSRLTQTERLNFLVTNRIPRRYATLFMRWFSRIENPVVRAASLAVWQRLGGDLRLHEAEHTRFRSLHDCFTRRLRPGARPIAGNFSG